MASPADVDIPHFDFPFTLTPDGAEVVEQDTREEVLAAVTNIVVCPRGFRVELPAFGIPSPAFGQAPLHTDQISAAISEWEPRAVDSIAEYADDASDAIRHIHIDVGTHE